MIKSNKYYEIHYPMNIYQKKAHVDAMNRTIAYFKSINVGVTQKQIVQILSGIHVYIIHLVNNMYKRKEKGYKSISKIGIGYFRTIYPKLFIDMRNSGEFTEGEFKIIRNEFYKKEFDIYYKILKQQKEWVKQRQEYTINHQKEEMQ